MMLRYSFDMGEAADDIRRAVTAVLDEGWRTGDIKQSDTPADKLVGTAQMGDLVVSRLLARSLQSKKERALNGASFLSAVSFTASVPSIRR